MPTQNVSSLCSKCWMRLFLWISNTVIIYSSRTVDASFQFYGQLEFVDFSNNQMSELPDKCFAKQSKLQHLQMDFNLIGNITNATFSGLKSLTYLSLRGNQLTSLNSQLDILEHVRNLKKILKLASIDLGLGGQKRL